MSAPTREQITEHYRLNFSTLEERLNGGKNSGIHALRRNAFQRFAELGFPTQRNEEWRFTNITPIATTEFSPVLNAVEGEVDAKIVEGLFLKGATGDRLVFINGHWSSRYSHVTDRSAGIRVMSLAKGLAGSDGALEQKISSLPFNDNAFTALSTAFLMDGAYIEIPEGTICKDPIQLVFITAGSTSPVIAQPRNLIVVGRGAHAAFVETYANIAGASLTNAVSDVRVGDGAVVEHDTLHSGGEEGYHIGTLHVSLGRDARFTSTSIAMGGTITRNTATVLFQGEGGECTLNGLSLATGSQLIDNHTVIDHAVPRCVSHELYKAILDGTSRGVFNGKVFVRRDAQKTDARQTNKTLLLSDTAVIDTKPQLEIFADDVKCTHGATVGQLDPEQIFYLRSRGIGAEEARDILTFAFASDVVQRIHVEPLREELDAMMRFRLTEGRIPER